MATADQYDDLIVIYLAGVAAETLIFGDHSSGAGGDERADLALATDFATMMERGFGFGEGWISDMGSGPRPLEYLRLIDTPLQAAVRARLDSAYKRTHEILAERLTPLRRLADLLVDRLDVDADEVRRICAEEEGR
jgi:ATP-dependent Zn protease